jgi:hypothetical protein
MYWVQSTSSPIALTSFKTDSNTWLEKVEALKTEVALLKCMQNLNTLHDLSPVEFFEKLKEHSGGKKFPLHFTLGLGLLTIYNSSSSAETDFSIMNGIVTLLYSRDWNIE